MSSNATTPLSRIIYLMYLVIFKPEIFKREEDMDARIQNAIATTQEPMRARIIRRGLLESLILCGQSITIGIMAGLFLKHAIGLGEEFGTYLLISGAGVFLWATFALRGWDIQSMHGSTLGERVNQWIFRTFYVFGTILITAGTLLTR